MLPVNRTSYKKMFHVHMLFQSKSDEVYTRKFSCKQKSYTWVRHCSKNGPNGVSSIKVSPVR